MSLLRFCVVSNALRLNLCRVYDPKHDRKATPDRKNKTDKPNESEEKSMTKTMNIEGMMCGMCESHVNDAVRKAFPVKKVTSSHSRKQTVVVAEEPIDEARLRQVIDATGYTVQSVSCEPYEKKGLFSWGK